MYAYIIGKVVHKNNNVVVLENNQIGYEINMSKNAIDLLESQKEYKIYTYYHVSQDAINLYGFNDLSEKSMFEKLISVSKIGVKTAIGILSNITPSKLAYAVISEDVQEVSKLPGLGKKTAQRLILEIKDKIKSEEMLELNTEEISEKQDMSKVKMLDVKEALIILGYNNRDIVNILEKLDYKKTTEEIIKDALKLMR